MPYLLPYNLSYEVKNLDLINIVCALTVNPLVPGVH